MELRLTSFFKQKKNQYDFSGLPDERSEFSMAADRSVTPTVCGQISVPIIVGRVAIVVPNDVFTRDIDPNNLIKIAEQSYNTKVLNKIAVLL